MPSGRFVGTNELQINSVNLIDTITNTGETCFITENGKARAVLMDIHRYNALMDLIEEAENPKNPGDETRKHASVRGMLERHSTRIVRRKRTN